MLGSWICDVADDDNGMRVVACKAAWAREPAAVPSNRNCNVRPTNGGATEADRLFSGEAKPYLLLALALALALVLALLVFVLLLLSSLLLRDLPKVLRSAPLEGLLNGRLFAVAFARCVRSP